MAGKLTDKQKQFMKECARNQEESMEISRVYGKAMKLNVNRHPKNQDKT